MKKKRYLILFLTVIAFSVVKAIVKVTVNCHYEDDDAGAVKPEDINVEGTLASGVTYHEEKNGLGVLKHQIEMFVSWRCVQVEFSLKGEDDLQELKYQPWPWDDNILELVGNMEVDFKNISKCQKVNVKLRIKTQTKFKLIAYNKNISPLMYSLQQKEDQNYSPSFDFSTGNMPSIIWRGFKGNSCKSTKVHTKGSIHYIIIMTDSFETDKTVVIDDSNYESIFEVKKYTKLNLIKEERCYMEFNVNTQVTLTFFETTEFEGTDDTVLAEIGTHQFNYGKKFVIRNDGNLVAKFVNKNITIVREDKKELECLDENAIYIDTSSQNTKEIEVYKISSNEAYANVHFLNCTEYMFNLSIPRFDGKNRNPEPRLNFMGKLFPEINEDVNNFEDKIKLEISTIEFENCPNLEYTLKCCPNTTKVDQSTVKENTIIISQDTGEFDLSKYDLSGMDCYAMASSGQGIEHSWTKIHFVPGKRSHGLSPVILVSMTILVIIIVFLIAGVLFYQYRFTKTKKLIPHFLNIGFNEVKGAYDRNSKQQQVIQNLPVWAHNIYEPIENLTLAEEIGKGSFGIVYKGQLKMVDDNTEVAVKTSIKKPRAEEELLNEGELMAKLGFHTNIINLLGVSVDTPENGSRFLLITEFCSKGGLLKKLRQMRKEQEKYATDENNEPEELDTKQLVGWTYQIALGMEFLSQTNTIHGDLAARNILLDSDNIVKIGDFGKAHSIDYSNIAVEVEGAQPLLWMAPEAIEESEITLESDKWSYGVTVWEIFALGSHPYSIMTTNPKDRTSNLKSDLKRGYRMPQPEWCPTRVYQDVMLPCWNLEPDLRPDWSDLVRLLSSLVDSEYLQNYNILQSKKRRNYQDIKTFDNNPFSFYV